MVMFISNFRNGGIHLQTTLTPKRGQKRQNGKSLTHRQYTKMGILSDLISWKVLIGYCSLGTMAGTAFLLMKWVW
jgi:hypothetical protein